MFYWPLTQRLDRIEAILEVIVSALEDVLNAQSAEDKAISQVLAMVKDQAAALAATSDKLTAALANAADPATLSAIAADMAAQTASLSAALPPVPASPVPIPAG
jgi:hypothetical protein